VSATTAIWLGIVQGLTEFLPVSSSGHLVIAQHFLPDFEQPGLTFDVVVHLGTLGAVLLYLRREVSLVLSGLKPGEMGASGRKLIGLLVVGTLPAVVAALAFQDAIEASFENLATVGISLGVTGLWLLFTSRYTSGARTLDRLAAKDALIVGLCQSAALVPGISRSGSTIGAGLAQGLTHGTAARFSFLLSVPAILGAAVFNLKDAATVSVDLWLGYAAGFSAAFAIGYLAIGIVIKFLESQRFHLFGYYCLALGGAVLVYVALGNS
jgi:undecaprenyl-diphosphatase